MDTQKKTSSSRIESSCRRSRRLCTSRSKRRPRTSRASRKEVEEEMERCSSAFSRRQPRSRPSERQRSPSSLACEQSRDTRTRKRGSRRTKWVLFFFVVFVLRRLDDDEDSRAFLEVVAETRKARRFLSLSLSLSSRASGRTRGGLMRLFCYVLEM